LIVLGYLPSIWPAAGAHEAAIGWSMFALAAIVQGVLVGPYLRGAWDRLRQGTSNMDTLIALGTSTAFGYGTARLIAGHAHDAHSFMDAGIILTLITLGKYLEVRSKGAGGRRDRTAARPGTEDGAGGPAGGEVEVALAEVRPGETVRVRPGEAVPVDGRVVEGRPRSTRRCSPASRPRSSRRTATGWRGARATGTARSWSRRTGLGSESALEGIVRLVREAQSSKAGVQRLADAISARFVPGVLAVAVATLIGLGTLGGDWGGAS
jgi:cation transport ATPase